jgi:hypothetical protein
MISNEHSRIILTATKNLWKEQVEVESFRAIFGGKEIGHRIADYVDQTTTNVILDEVPSMFEMKSNGKVMTRSMGDIWVKSNGIMNPLNVKAGEAGKNGQPNLVSLNKILSALLTRKIDSYYLLIIKFSADMDELAQLVKQGKSIKDKIQPQIYFVDMLDHLDHVVFDSGPGQLMLKEGAFYAFMEAGLTPPSLTLSEKIKRLVDLREDGDRRLIANRKATLETMRKNVEKFAKNPNRAIDQTGYHFG